MKFYDISMDVYPNMQVWENIKENKPVFDRQTNGHVTATTATLGLHTGTHIDAPLHMINNADTFETIQLERLVRKVKVLDLENVEDGITRSDLEAHTIESGDFLLCKTKNSYYSSEHFDFNFIYLKEDGADYLVKKRIEGIGIDTLGIERSQEGNPTHRNLFRDDIIIVEGLRLKDVLPGEYFMVAAPLKLVGTEAAPARVLLFDQWPSA
ncbi:cyclase family protein [Gracilibacillus thailandensis]|uniref:Kynurenine formamidase n=1 Tax=Gracilibacillus thailandensis TaxID=563735 RepID=A0A6N7R031_9BACI|nr:cyclase family protein [Gracilibacillus thailandensis]MRI66822.1 cyclase family protein [Gracilibacillus thailandensis]